MIAWLGLGATLTALAAAAVLAWRGLPALLARGPVTADRVRGPVRWLLGGAIAAMLMLELGLVTDDFSIAYIANNHRTGTPLIFTVAAGWAALEGSIVLWGLVLAIFTASAFRAMYRSEHPLAGGTMSILGMLATFWFGLMVTVANPFAVCTSAAEAGCSVAAWAPWSPVDAPVDGRGANPLLQNHILMAVHPPLLYAGYVGFSVPFAIGMASLAAARRGDSWLEVTRRWTLTAWGFLTVGIVLGAWWSYEVLGWGGYWAWDPVENASFIPWLLATAFIHSTVVQARRGVLQSWNYVLVIGTFAATILGTFLTRSGVIASVHSFTQSAIGPALLGFLALILVGALACFAARIHLVGSAPRLDSLASREGAFLLNNLLLAVFAFVVLSGTLFPLGIEAFRGATVGVGRPFFDRWAVPLSYCLLLTMGIGPVTPFRVARPRVLWQRLRTPLRIALAIAAVVVLVVSRNRHVIIVALLATLVVSAIARHLLTLARSRSAATGEGAFAAAGPPGPPRSRLLGGPDLAHGSGDPGRRNRGFRQPGGDRLDRPEPRGTHRVRRLRACLRCPVLPGGAQPHGGGRPDRGIPGRTAGHRPRSEAQRLRQHVGAGHHPGCVHDPTGRPLRVTHPHRRPLSPRRRVGLPPPVDGLVRRADHRVRRWVLADGDRSANQWSVCETAAWYAPAAAFLARPADEGVPAAVCRGGGTQRGASMAAGARQVVLQTDHGGTRGDRSCLTAGLRRRRWPPCCWRGW